MLTLSSSSASLKCYDGLSTRPRLTITTPETVLLDGSGATQLRINTNGVQISNAYRLPAADGAPNRILTTNGAGVVSFQPPAVQTRIEDTGSIGSQVKCESSQVIISTFYPPTGNFILDIQPSVEIGQVLTAVGIDGAAQWKLPALGPVAFGGNTAVVGNFLRYSGAHDSVTSSVVSEVGNNYVVNQASICTSVSYDTQTGDATTQFTIFKNGVVLLSATYALTGLRGVIDLDNFAFDAGDTCQIRYTAGTSPGRQTHTINFV
jgi:hypothetical protein